MYELRHYWPGDRTGDIVTGWESLVYYQRLNDVQQLILRFPPDNPWVSEIREWSRFSLMRGNEVVWYGYLMADSWGDPPEAFDDPCVTFYGKDLTEEAYISRILPPNYVDTSVVAPVGFYIWRYDYEYFTPPAMAADDLCKLVVAMQMVAPEQSLRRRVLISCEPSYGKAPVATRRWCGTRVLDALQEIGNTFGVWWRFVPSTAGAEFRTRYPLWGMDRREGTDYPCIFDQRMGTVQHIYTERNWAEAKNVAFVRGQITQDPRMFIAYDYESIARYRWRESWADVDQYGAIQDMLDQATTLLRANRVQTSLTVMPAHGTYKTLWDVGDQVTVITRRGDYPVTIEPVIIGAKIEVGPEDTEQVTEVTLQEL